MSEKRQRQQQRRRRRKAHRADRVWDTPARGGASVGRGRATRLAQLAEIAARGAHDPADALQAEAWASSLIGTMGAEDVLGADVEGILLPGLIAALERRGGEGALATLRALAAVTRPEHARSAVAAADRLAATGLREPAWGTDLGLARPTTAALMSQDAFDDGAGLLVEFETAGALRHTIAVYVDNNMGGLVKHVGLVGPLAEVRPGLEGDPSARNDASIRDLDLAEARGRIAAGLDALDDTFDPPVGDTVGELRALLEARLRTLPDGGESPAAEGEPPGAAERDELLDDFLRSPDGERWRSDELAAAVVELAIDFGSDENHGGPLRWSPVVVDIFMTSWLPRTVLIEREFFEHVPAVLADWVRYAGRRRGVPRRLIREAVANVATCREPMLQAVDDLDGWGAAQAFGIAAREAGVDLTDPDELARFVDGYNDGLAA